MTNDNWNGQNTTTNEATGALLDRTKFDELNPTHDVTLGGPIVRDRAWYFATYEFNQNTSGQRQTSGLAPENYQQQTKSKLWFFAGDGRLGANHSVGFKYHRSATNGFVYDFWAPVFAAGERSALTLLNEEAQTFAAQWAGVFGSNWTADATFAGTGRKETLAPFELSTLDGGAPHLNITDRRAYNGPTFNGLVEPAEKADRHVADLFHRPAQSENRHPVGEARVVQPDRLS